MRRNDVGAGSHRNVVTQGLTGIWCCGCGVCASVCPVDGCLTMQLDENLEYKPRVDSGLCAACGMCVRVCPSVPGASDDFSSLHQSSVGKKTQSLGYVRSCYVGYQTDENLRLSSASGGLLSAVLLELLNTGEVDRVVAVRQRVSDEEPWFVTDILDEIGVNASRGSKYYPVEFSSVLRRIREEEGTYAVVALPCVAIGIRRAQAASAVLRRRIRYVLSPMCGHNVNGQFLSYMMQVARVDPATVSRISFRNKRNTRSAADFALAFWSKAGGDASELFFQRSPLGKVFCGYLFTPDRCLLCSDFAGEVADASFGDAWLPEYIGDTRGTSMLVVRDERIDQLLKDMTSGGQVFLKASSVGEIERAQRGAISFKKEYVGVRSRMVLGRGGNDCGAYIPRDIRRVQSFILSKRINRSAVVAARLSKRLFGAGHMGVGGYRMVLAISRGLNPWWVLSEPFLVLRRILRASIWRARFLSRG